MRIGYYFHGFMGDVKYEGKREVSTPDGNAAYSWSIVYEGGQRSHEVIPLHKDRDEDGYRIHGIELFSSFSKEKRFNSYHLMDAYRSKYGSVTGFPELDVVLIEWRWPIPDRNCVMNSDGSWFVPNGMQTDLLRQWELIRHYQKTKTPIVLWDLDHKLTYRDEQTVKPAAVFETSVNLMSTYVVRTRVEPPTVVADLLQHKTLPVDPLRKMAYVGSRYERDDVISEWIEPVSDQFPGQVEFWGKWDGADKLWKNVKYMGRIGMRDFMKAYGTAACCPLLAKRSYMKSGFISPRPWEALLFGTLPVGLSCHAAAWRYTNGIFACDAADLSEITQWFAGMTLQERHIKREELAHDLKHMDVSHFVDSIEDVVNGIPPNSRIEVQKEEG